MIDPEKPVGKPEQFVGQSGLVRRIFSRIGAERPQSVAVIGGKKSGKTSLLAYIGSEAARKAHLGESPEYLFCAVPAGEPDSRSPEGFLRSLRGQLPGGAREGPNGYEALRAAVDGLHHAGRRLVLLLDDFHIVTSSHAFPLEFFSFLRSLANNFNLAFVTTSFLELQKLCAVKDVQESPFFNIFTNLSLGMLSPGEASGLVAALTGWQREQCVLLAEWCGGSPYLLKLAAARLLQAPGQVPAESAELERLLLPVVSPHFEEVVSLLVREAARPLQALARGKQPDSSEAHFLSPLVKQGFLAERADGAACVSPAFCAFLRGPFSPRMLKGRG